METSELQNGIQAISIKGFKAIAKEVCINIRPLTVFAGANSSGKSSIMQALLLLKQTLEAPYEPEGLLLDGENVSFSSADDVLTIGGEGTFEVGIRSKEFASTLFPSLGLYHFKSLFTQRNSGLQLVQSDIFFEPYHLRFTADMDSDDVHTQLMRINPEHPRLRDSEKVLSARVFFELSLPNGGNTASSIFVRRQLQKIIHVSGVRPHLRFYPATALPNAISNLFKGRFEHYVASIINYWQTQDDERLKILNAQIQYLGLGTHIEANRQETTKIALKMSRLPNGNGRKKRDLINIADVGVGVSQVLPVLVALLVANEGQLVYLEQPEIHLHPRAQVALAEMIANAAKRGVKVIVETHSTFLLTSLQTLVAQGKLNPELPVLYWFERDKKGYTQVTETSLNRAGQFETDWPSDFAEIQLQTESDYLEAAENVLLGDVAHV